MKKEDKVKRDEIDEVNTTDIENDYEEEATEIPEEFYARHNINIAKLFLGKDGGYSLR